jgi:hypothetical protein
MADAIKLIGVAEDRGFQLKVEHFLKKKAVAILIAGSPANDLVLAKSIAYSGAPGGGESSQIVNRFSHMLVTVSAVATALEGTTPPYDHKQFADATFETQVNNLWPTYVNAVI